MLFLTNGDEFAAGRADFLDHAPGVDEGTAKVFVRIELTGLEAEVFAQLDTGAAWSVLSPDIADALGLLDGEGEPIALETKYGRMHGRLETATLTLLADEGDELDVEGAQMFVCRAWPSGSFLGYSGLLERVRFALDPQRNHFYFGPG